jgi:hypothetical protein
MVDLEGIYEGYGIPYLDIVVYTRSIHGETILEGESERKVDMAYCSLVSI